MRTYYFVFDKNVFEGRASVGKLWTKWRPFELVVPRSPSDTTSDICLAVTGGTSLIAAWLVQRTATELSPADYAWAAPPGAVREC
jgi:hypothetical protein